MSAAIELARQWLSKASNDLLNADNNLQADDIPSDTVCFHCQQAAEKLLKAYLIAQEQQPPFTHDLLLLLENILPIEPAAESLRDALATLMPYAVEIRYPGDVVMPSEQDTQEARAKAEDVRAWLQDSMPDLFA